jgi:aspartate oxidase
MAPEDRPYLQRIMTASAGLSRDEDGLAVLVGQLQDLARDATLQRTAADAENAHLRLAALVVAQAALARRESRGSHRRSDHPEQDPAWRHAVLTRMHDGGLRTSTERAEITA